MWAKGNGKGKSRRGGEQRVAITVGQECSKWSKDRKVPASDNNVSCQKRVWEGRQEAYANHTYCDYANLTAT